MPKLKGDDVADLDIKALDDAEWSEGDFESYDGDIPKDGTILTAYVKKMWWTRTQNDDPMLKVLVVAAENEGDEEEFDGLPMWENMALIPSVKFRWKPFIDRFGITLKDIRNNTYVADTDDSMGAPIERIGSFEPGEESEAAWCRVLVKRSRYDGEWRAGVKRWLEMEDEEAEEEEPEDEEEEIDEEAEDDGEEEEEENGEEEEEEPEPPAKPARRAAAVSKPTKPAATRKPATAKSAAKPTATRAGQRTTKPATRTAAKPTAAKTATKGARARRQSNQGFSDDPPF